MILHVFWGFFYYFSSSHGSPCLLSFYLLWISPFLIASYSCRVEMTKMHLAEVKKNWSKLIRSSIPRNVAFCPLTPSVGRYQHTGEAHTYIARAFLIIGSKLFPSESITTQLDWGANLVLFLALVHKFLN